jgi:membrane-associated phospholipid phosphatase
MVLCSLLSGCASEDRRPVPDQAALEAAVAGYQASRCEQIADSRKQRPEDELALLSREWADLESRGSGFLGRTGAGRVRPLTLGMFGDESAAAGESVFPDDVPTSQAATRPAGFVPPEGYWRQDIWHQMGHEGLEFGSRGLWHGFKTSFWDLENALVLTATMGVSVTIRETGVDDTIRNRTHGSNVLADFDEPIQILGNPGTHFAAAGVLWVTSTLAQDVKQHELAKTLGEALAVNGISTLVLKGAANTRAPDHERHAWPSGHTSSAFTVAAVLNEYYGPLVGVPSLALAGLVGFQRLDSRVHDFSDVVFGGMLGYVIGTSIARDEKAKFPELFGMQVIPYADPQTGATGLALYKSW